MHIIWWHIYSKASEQAEDGMSWVALAHVNKKSFTMNRVLRAQQWCHDAVLTAEKGSSQDHEPLFCYLQVHYEPAELQTSKVYRKDLYTDIQQYFSVLQQVMAIKGPDILTLNTHLCYKKLSHVRLLSLIGMHVLKLEKLFSHKPHQKKPSSIEQHNLSGHRIRTGEHFYSSYCGIRA